jgi:hypothetical protein
LACFPPFRRSKIRNQNIAFRTHPKQYQNPNGPIFKMSTQFLFRALYPSDWNLLRMDP